MSRCKREKSKKAYLIRRKLFRIRAPDLSGTIFMLLHGLEWVEIELSAEEENADAVVLKVTEAAGVSFEALDL